MKLLLTSFVVLVAVALVTSPVFAQVEFLDEQFEWDTANPAAGSWQGNVSVPQAPGQVFFAALVVGADDAGETTVYLNCLPLSAMHAACKPLAHEDGSFAFAYAVGGLELHFRGAISEDGQRYSGEVIHIEGNEPAGTPETFEFARTPRAVDLDNHLAFTGELEAQTTKIRMSIVLAQTPGGNWVGNLDIPSQMLRAFPLINFTETDGTITAELAVPGGASIDMNLEARNQRLSGVFHQSGLQMPFSLPRDMNYAYKELTRPQVPKPPFPYEQREVTAAHPDEFTITGTLTIPDRDAFGEGPFPVAVMISGSGQQDRDESLLGHKPFLVIADHLTRHGIAVMRYDDRGVGGTGGLDTLETATSHDFATDTLAVVNQLRTIEDIDAERIGLIGHSEGGMIAPLVGTMTDDIAFMVLMAGPGVSGRELLDVQRKKLSMAAGISEADADEQNVVINELIDIILNGGTIRDAVNRAMEINAEDPDPAAAGLTDEQLRSAIRGQLSQLANEWMKYFLVYDPAAALREVKCPVLALNGTLDLQVWHTQNLDAIRRILTEVGADVTAKRYENLNHLFQRATTGSVSEYSEIETTIEPVVLDDMTNWILEKTGGKE